MLSQVEVHSNLVPNGILTYGNYSHTRITEILANIRPKYCSHNISHNQNENNFLGQGSQFYE